MRCSRDEGGAALNKGRSHLSVAVMLRWGGEAVARCVRHPIVGSRSEMESYECFSRSHMMARNTWTRMDSPRYSGSMLYALKLVTRISERGLVLRVEGIEGFARRKKD